MPKKSKGKHRLDKFYHLAKEQGYRSRAAFKLIQLNRKYDFLTGCRSLLDLCAAPGGWLQVAAKTMPVSSLIVGVDLDPIRPIRGCRTLVGDITTQKTRQDLKKAAGGNSMDVVLHDGAPNVGGAWSSEAYQQSWLVLEALKLATEFLAPRGTFVTKVFRSQDYNALLYAFNQLFDRVDATKPVASRNTSAEIFVTCKGYKAPARIDPRLLDAKHLFKETVEAAPAAGPDALLKDKIKQKRHREGYEEGVSVMHRPAPAASFIAAERPVEALGRFTSFALDGPGAEAADAPAAGEEGEGDDAAGNGMVLGMAAGAAAAAIRDHPATTAEIRELCGDLQVLGRSEFKALLKWRLRVRKDLLAKAAAPVHEEEDDAGAAAIGAGEGDGEDAKEAALLAEMSKVKEAAERRQKKEKKRKREAKTKARVRAAQMALGEGINDAEGDEPLFSLAAVKGRGAVDRVGADTAPDAPDELLASSDDEDTVAAAGASGDEAAGSDVDDAGYTAMTEAALEDAFAEYQRRQGQRASAARRKRRRLGQATELDGTGSASEDDDALAAGDGGGFAEAPASEDDEEGDGLLVKLDEQRAGRPPTSAAVAAQWFAQDLFDGAEDDDQEAEDDLRSPRGKLASGQPAATATAQSSRELPDAAAADDSEDGGVTPPRTPPPASGSQSERGAAAKPLPAAARGTAAESAPDSFQVVPRAASDSESDTDAEPGGREQGEEGSDADFMEDLDVAGKAEVLALAKRMLRRKTRDELLEGAYNKYAFHDAGALPRWFAEDQQRYARPPPVLTREELEAEKQELAAIDARPIKKIAEAKARKKRRLAVSLEKARQKSEAIVGQEDVPMRSRMKEVEKIYAKARAAGKGPGKKKQTRSAKQASSRKGRPLDRRMMSDKRETHSKRKKAATKKRTKGKRPGGGGAKGKGGGGRR